MPVPQSSQWLPMSVIPGTIVPAPLVIVYEGVQVGVGVGVGVGVAVAVGVGVGVGGGVEVGVGVGVGVGLGVAVGVAVGVGGGVGVAGQAPGWETTTVSILQPWAVPLV